MSRGGNTASRTPKVVYTPWQTIGVPYTATSTVAPASPALQSAVAATVTDPIGRTTTMMVDRWGQPMCVTDALSQVTQYTRTGYLLTQVQYPDGSGESYSYVYGTPLVSQATLSADSSVYYRYGVLSQVDSVWGMGAVPQRRFLDATTGRVDSIRFSSADSTMIRYIYDAFNRVIRVREPDGREIRYQYEWRLGNRDSIGLPGGMMSIRRFDGYGRDSITWSSGAQHWTRTVYDSLNRVRKQWSAGFADDTVIVSYDALFPTRVRTPGGQIHKFEYNALGWLTKAYDVADTTRFLSYRYDTAGRMTSMTNRRNQRIDLKYDAVDRLLVRSGMNIPTDSFTYQNGPSGRIVSGVRGNVQDFILYNWRKTIDSLVHQIDGKSYTIRYKESKYTNYIEWETVIENDTSGGGTSVSFARKISRLYPGATTLDSVFVSGGSGAGWFVGSINRNGELQSTTFPSPPSFARWYDYSALHVPVLSGFTSGASQDSLNRGFGYDSLGKLARELRTRGLWTESRTFSYDALGQLIKVQRASQYTCGYLLDSIIGVPPGACDDIPVGTEDSATYDAAGNRLIVGASYGSGNRLLTWPGYSYTYDLDGNVATRTHGGVTDSLFWSATNQLDSIRSGGLRVAYDYDAFGRLTRRRKNGAVDRYFLWDGEQLIAELAGSGTARIAQYIYHGGIDQPFAIATDSAGTSLIRYFAQDMQGNVIGIMRNTTLHQYSTYTAWGQFEIRAPNILGDTNRLGWKGLLYEGDSTKLYYMRNRWYDPQIGRFINQDPVGLSGGTNPYTFAGNDPINGFDPWGLTPVEQDPYVLDTYFVYGSRRYREWDFTFDSFWLQSGGRGVSSLGALQRRPSPRKIIPYEVPKYLRKGKETPQQSPTIVQGISCTVGNFSGGPLFTRRGIEASESFILGMPGVGCSSDTYVVLRGDKPSDFGIFVGSRHHGSSVYFDRNGVQAVGYHAGFSTGGGISISIPVVPMSGSYVCAKVGINCR